MGLELPDYKRLECVEGPLCLPIDETLHDFSRIVSLDKDFLDTEIAGVKELSAKLRALLMDDFGVKTLRDLEGMDIQIFRLNSDRKIVTPKRLSDLIGYLEDNGIEFTYKGPINSCFQKLAFNESNKETLETILKIFQYNQEKNYTKSLKPLEYYKHYFELTIDDIKGIDLRKFVEHYPLGKVKLEIAIKILKTNLDQNNVYYTDRKGKEHNKKI